jgi:hypothetical protein
VRYRRARSGITTKSARCLSRGIPSPNPDTPRLRSQGLPTRQPNRRWGGGRGSHFGAACTRRRCFHPQPECPRRLLHVRHRPVWRGRPSGSLTGWLTHPPSRPASGSDGYSGTVQRDLQPDTAGYLGHHQDGSVPDQNWLFYIQIDARRGPQRKTGLEPATSTLGRCQSVSRWSSRSRDQRVQFESTSRFARVRARWCTSVCANVPRASHRRRIGPDRRAEAVPRTNRAARVGRCAGR